MSPTVWGAMKATARVLGLRKTYPPVDPRFTKPTGLYDPGDVDLNKLTRLIKHGKLAPCYPGREFPDDDEFDFDVSEVQAEEGKAVGKGQTQERGTEGAADENGKTEASQMKGKDSTKRVPCDECPICFLSYPALNKSKCCASAICTECFLRVRSPSNAPEVYDSVGRRLTIPPRCPFCKTKPYLVVFLGAKTRAEREAEAETNAALALALAAARTAELTTQNERRARRELAASSASSTHTQPSTLLGGDTTNGDDAGGGGTSDPEPAVGNGNVEGVPLGWEEEYAAATPLRRVPNVATSTNAVGWIPSPAPAPYPANADRLERLARRDLEEETRRRLVFSRRRERNAAGDGGGGGSTSSRRAERRRAFLPQGPAFLPGRSNPELFTRDLFGDNGGRGDGFLVGRARGRPASGAAFDPAGDERRILRELARREGSRQLRLRSAAAANEGTEESESAAVATAVSTNAEDAFVQRMRDFIPARLLEESFGELGDGEAGDGATRRVLDIDDVMMMEAVYLSLGDVEGRTGGGDPTREEARALAEATEAAEVEEAIALVAAAEAAEAAARAGGERAVAETAETAETETAETAETETAATAETDTPVEQQQASADQEDPGDDASDAAFEQEEVPGVEHDGVARETDERTDPERFPAGFELRGASLPALVAETELSPVRHRVSLLSHEATQPLHNDEITSTGPVPVETKSGQEFGEAEGASGTASCGLVVSELLLKEMEETGGASEIAPEIAPPTDPDPDPEAVPAAAPIPGSGAGAVAVPTAIGDTPQESSRVENLGPEIRACDFRDPPERSARRDEPDPTV